MGGCKNRMKFKKYTFDFLGKKIVVVAQNEQEAEILAKAEAIKNGWNYLYCKQGR